MKTLPNHPVDEVTGRLLAGDPPAVFPLAERVTAVQMQASAVVMNLSESTSALPPKGAGPRGPAAHGLLHGRASERAPARRAPRRTD